MTPHKTSLHHPASGAYILQIRLLRPARIQVGALGVAAFGAGVYLYIGSARRGLNSRINRHQRLSWTKKGPKHWHIDYLLHDSAARIVAVGRFPQQEECDLSEKVATLEGAQVSFRGFGSSDCKRGCAAHLYSVTAASLKKFGHVFTLSMADNDFA
jgi:Uri superfamily endonuclease